MALDIDYTIDDADKILKALESLKQEQPIQYILGDTEFYGLPFKVNNHVLIPRPETEELVEWVFSEVEDLNSEIRILDIGTGSGCIAISLAKQLTNAEVFALDVCKEALKTAKQNAELNNVKVEFIEADILKWNQESRIKNQEFFFGKDVSKRQKGLFDIIVSNPPYVRNQEKQQMKGNVLDNEPHLALFVEDDNPLQFYNAITEFAKNNLNKNGKLFFEINEYLGSEMIQLLKTNNFIDLELKQDIFKKDRMIKGLLS